MAITLDQVRDALLPDEPDYPGSAKKLGVEALPHLEQLVTGDHTGLAAKAAYLAGLIGTDKCISAIQKAARSAHPAVRIAAAAAASHLPSEYTDVVLLQLVDDSDAGVQKVALRSVPAAMSDTLKARVESVHASLGAVKPKKKTSARKPSAKKPTKKSQRRKE